jgi:protein involved in polysaccharide export with SLBB domain
MRKVFLGCFLMFVLLSDVYSQSVSPRDVKVETVSDSQIRRLMNEIERRGLSEQEAISFATAYGLTPTQIDQFRRRIQTIDDDKEEKKKTEFDSFSDDGSDKYFSQKARIDTTKEDKQVFGFHLFNSKNLSFEPSVNFAVSPNYVVGSGDEIVIDVYGASQQQFVLKVDKNGNIIIPNVGPLSVGGLELSAAETRIFNKLTLIYRDLISAQPRTFLNIHLGQVKAINVSVIGEVFAPGTYTLPGTATAFNALYLSGGPNFNGSFRTIRIIREGKEVTVLDVYDFLINGNTTVNAPLRDGDVILVPTYQKRVRIGGEFIRTGIFESKEGETIDELVKYAGGFNEFAYRSRIELHRNNGREYVFADLFQEDFNNAFVQSGDSLYAGRILDRFTNRVFIEGAVFRPGMYELTEGLTLRQLIERADGVREDAFLERGLILRLNKDLSLSNVSFNVSDIISNLNDIELQREDAIMITPLDSMRENRIVNIHGEINNPGMFDYRDRMTLGDIIVIAGGFRESASESYIEVTRRLSHDEASVYGAKNANLYQFTVPRSLSMNRKDSEFELKAFDQIYVRRAPGYTEEALVIIAGEVLYAGQYGLSKRNERLSEIIARTGGLTPDAYASGAMLTRRIELTPKARRLRESLKESSDGIEFSELGFEVVGVDLSKAIQNPGSRDDVILRDGDELVVPRKLFTVNIDGEVLNPITMPYIEGRGFRYYINQGGGFALRAKRNKAYVIYPNGSAAATRNFLFFSSYPEIKPGSQIIVPQKPERERMPATAWVAIGSGVSSLALTVVSIVNATK